MNPRVVAFAKDWEDVPTCITHVLREMGRSMPVLWINSIGTRGVRLSQPGDIKRVGRRLRALWRGAEVKENQLRVVSLLLIPRAKSSAARQFNRWLFRLQVESILETMGAGPIEYWCSVPNAVDLLPRLQPGDKIVYYCVDDWSKYHNLDGSWLADREAEMLRRADIVFTPARYLVSKCKEIAGDRVHYVPHGVEYARFARALDSHIPKAADIANFPRPVIGFYGNIYPWIDFKLVESLAVARPAWSFVIIGQVYCDISRLKAVPNIHILGRRDHDVLPDYCRGFDAAIIPYDMGHERMESVNPVKTRELLAAGVPIVASKMPELSEFGNDVMICKTVDEWLLALESQVQRHDRHEISGRQKGEDWREKVQTMRRVADRIDYRMPITRNA